MGKRIITTENLEEDIRLEGELRPQRLTDYIGQEKAKQTLSVYIEAAKARGEALDHVLFYGPPGLGKTTLAGIIANEMGVHMKVTSGPAIEKPGEMAAILNSLQEHDVLFVDEIHRLNRQVEEVLYPAMEDYAIDIMIGKGAGARSIRLNLPKFTLVGATTRAGMLTAPLRDRFGVVNRLEFYTDEELKTIILRSASVLDVEIEEDGALELARRSRGTPRLANRLLKRVRDFAQVKYDGRITKKVADYALDLLDVDKYGLDHIDRSILLTMIEKFQGGPVGLDTLAAAISEDAGTLEDVYEPYLLKNGFIQRTPRGRVVTELAYRHLGIPMTFEGDWSAAVNFIVAAAIFGTLTIKGLNLGTTQADKKILEVVRGCGALVEELPDDGGIRVSRGSLRAFDFDATDSPDLLPALSVLAAFSEGTSHFTGVARLRNKESNRPVVMEEGLKAMGVPASVDGDEMDITGISLSRRIVEGKMLKGGSFHTFSDHRVAMALKIASLGCESKVTLDSTDCIDKSFPGFLKLFESIHQ